MSLQSTALLVVEPDFLETHVGVRRVILYYWRRLVERGFTVQLATPVDGELKLGEAQSLRRIEAMTSKKQSDTPEWKARRGTYSTLSNILRHLSTGGGVRWTAQTVRAEDYAVSVVTNPWLCARGLPDAPYTAGIVYDMVPNLLACGALNLGVVVDIYGFANEHDLGYQSYLRNAREIHCISDSARSDFCNFYGLAGECLERLSTLMPFEIASDSRVRWREGGAARRPRIILVNVLDPRKNFRTVRKVLARAAAAGHLFDIDIVGRERMSMSQVRPFLDELSTFGGEVNWYRAASEACLARLYADAELLLFPSLYEGLGLPILEAQAHGTPVVSSNTSSCGEVNINTDLSCDPLDVVALTNAVTSVLDRTSKPLVGCALQSALSARLTSRNTLPSAWRPA